MKMVKSLLLGSAAGLVAVAGAQAADLPVKAKPVEYVKICSLYGEGFYYIPGTDTCIKIGGFVFMNWSVHAAVNDFTYIYNTAAVRDNREDSKYYNTRARGAISADVRTQTEYGTLRSYVSGGWEYNTDETVFNTRGQPIINTAFIQFAGFTAGHLRSFFDFYAYQLQYGGGLGVPNHSKINITAYTFQFGGGFSATISVEDATAHRTNIWDTTGNPLVAAASPGPGQISAGNTFNANYGGTRYPDLIANLRVDQPWGSAQLSGAIHEVTAGYYCGNTVATFQGTGATCSAPASASSGVPANGHPDDKIGFAVSAGVKFNLPWAAGDELWIQGTYTKGALGYIGFNTTSSVHSVWRFGGGNQLAMGIPTDAIFGGNPTIPGSLTNLELTTGWGLLAGIQHYWTPMLRTSVFGSIASVDYGGNATAIFCGSAQGSATAGAITSLPGSTAAKVAAGEVCNPDFVVWQVGTRTIWNPVKNLDIGLEVLYSRVDQSMSGTYNINQIGGIQGGVYNAADLGNWSGALHIQRNFWP